MTASIDDFHASTFAEHLHSKFKVSTDGFPPIEMELADVAEPDAPAHVEVFTLTFRGPRAPILPQQICRLEHATLGAFQLFLTAVAADQKGTDYEAVFNRMRKKS